MKPRYQVSRSAIELIKRFEGYRSKSARLADGRWTIGYGHTLTAREGAEVSEQDAEALLIYDLIAVAHSVNEWVYTPLTQNQFDALTAFAFNIGLDNFRGSSVLRRLNEGALIQAACAMELWRKAEFEGERIVVDALVRRRSAEKTLFLTPANGWTPAPSPLLRPNLDMDSTGVVPRQAPTALSASLIGGVASVERDEANQERPVAASDDGQAPSPATTAAASVASRLSTILSDDDAANVRLVAEGVAPGPRLVIEETAEAALAPFPQALGGEAELAFNLTPPENDHAPSEHYPRKLELVAANESEPRLFEGLEAVTGMRRPLPEAEIEYGPETEASALLPFEDEEEPASVFGAARRPPKRKVNFLPALGLAVTGVALFGGCLFWAISVPDPVAGGVFNPGTMVWLAGIAGVGLIGVAVYMILDRLGHAGAEQVEASLERDE
ncbi:MAG TPA: lysozyme [Phenylobacterium sp.]|nr:lysozyme [Phenylobacterium sp.]